MISLQGIIANETGFKSFILTPDFTLIELSKKWKSHQGKKVKIQAEVKIDLNDKAVLDVKELEVIE